MRPIAKNSCAHGFSAAVITMAPDYSTHCSVLTDCGRGGHPHSVCIDGEEAELGIQRDPNGQKAAQWPEGRGEGGPMKGVSKVPRCCRLHVMVHIPQYLGVFCFSGGAAIWAEEAPSIAIT